MILDLTRFFEPTKVSESTKKALLNKKTRQAAIIQARKEGATLQAIGEVLGVTRERVRQLEAHGPKWKPKKRGKTGPRKKTLERDKKIVKYYKKGIPVQEIADMLGIGLSTVKGRIERLHKKRVIGYRVDMRKRRKRKKKK